LSSDFKQHRREDLRQFSRNVVGLNTDDRIDTLEFWYENKASYPILAAAARLFLCVQATQCSCQRIFSIGGKIDRPDRSTMKDTTLKQRLLVRENLDLVT
jgi:hypothetical protein